MNRILRRGALPVIAAVALLAVAVPAAGAHPVKVVGGKTKLALSAKAKAALQSLGITATGTTYSATGGTYSFHALNDEGGGTIKHSGGLALSNGSVTARLSRLWIEIPVAEHEGDEGDHHATHSHGDKKVLEAAVGGKRIAVATLKTKSYRVLDEEPGFRGLTVVLNKPGAKLLNQSFGTTAFKKGLVLGTLSNESKVKEIEDHS